MKIMVDSVPQKASECMFGNYGTNYIFCRISNTKCGLECNEKCDKLIGLNGISVTIPNQITYGKKV